ncbi:nucleoside monophosphate kinase [Maribacter sp. BPC-D8]|uniref:nucleoside monophosphate kinase n=1 Tax=Maribacter sp. BPC-D8 TaxID=3053613 RepID=UPI002B4786CA|nr:nucleoside monophosphate kinase [Maribacter sp. BPC-D8]WRI28591.1 nucleoside monophosphate kinase [Maribacter sp. BPC-D8]
MKKIQIVIADYNSGSQTFCEKLNEINSSKNIDLRELIRSEIREKSVLGKEIKDCIDKGKLLDTNLINKLITKEISKYHSDITILNYPRTEEQYNSLIKIINIDKFWHLKLDNIDYLAKKEYLKIDKNYSAKYDITIETIKKKIITKQNEYQLIVDIMQKDLNYTLISIDYGKESSMIDYFIDKIKSA